MADSSPAFINEFEFSAIKSISRKGSNPIFSLLNFCKMLPCSYSHSESIMTNFSVEELVEQRFLFVFVILKLFDRHVLSFNLVGYLCDFVFFS